MNESGTVEKKSPTYIVSGTARCASLTAKITTKKTATNNRKCYEDKTEEKCLRNIKQA